MTFTSNTQRPSHRSSLLGRLKAWKRRLMSKIVMDHQAWWDITVEEFRFNRLTGMRYN